MRICICGGGHLGHVCAGVLASHVNVEVNILSSKARLWKKKLHVTDIAAHEYVGDLNLVTDIPELAVEGADLILLCLPGFAIEDTLLSLKPYLKDNQILGSIVSSTGFFFMAKKILGNESKLFGFQRTPFIARTNEYGSSAYLLGYKSAINIAVENIDVQEEFRQMIEKLFLTPTVLLNNYLEASLTNSNPILHTGRLYSLWSDWHGEIYDHHILFYKEWTDHASELIVNMDNEFMSLLDKLPVNKEKIPSLLDYYESIDITSLTKKISSIPAFQTIFAPMLQVKNGWIPDFSSRYFLEDFPYGLKHIIELGHKYDVKMSYMENVYDWGMSVIK
jgi:hypothetical protein